MRVYTRLLQHVYQYRIAFSVGIVKKNFKKKKTLPLSQSNVPSVGYRRGAKPHKTIWYVAKSTVTSALLDG